MRRAVVLFALAPFALAACGSTSSSSSQTTTTTPSASLKQAAHQYFRSSGSHFVTRTGAVDSSTPPSRQRVIVCTMKFSSSRVG